MTLSDTGEARVRGYLYVLERSLRSSLPPAVVTDAVREVESHIRERVAETEPLPDERAAVERLLAALGTPTRVARGYSLELSVEEALTTGRVTLRHAHAGAWRRDRRRVVGRAAVPRARPDGARPHAQGGPCLAPLDSH
jgi:hypothetical protein